MRRYILPTGEVALFDDDAPQEYIQNVISGVRTWGSLNALLQKGAFDKLRNDPGFLQLPMMERHKIFNEFARKSQDFWSRLDPDKRKIFRDHVVAAPGANEKEAYNYWEAPIFHRDQEQSASDSVLEEFGNAMSRANAPAWAHIYSGLTSGLAQLDLAIGGAMGAEEPKSYLQPWADSARKIAEDASIGSELMAPAPKVDEFGKVHGWDDFTMYLAQAVGSQVPILGSMAAVGAVTGGWGAIPAGMALEIGSIQEDLTRNGFDPKEAQKTAALYGSMAGALEGLPVANLIRRIPGAKKGFTGFLLNHLQNMPIQALEEAVTEGAQTVLERAARDYLYANQGELEQVSWMTPEGRRSLWDEAQEAMIQGGLVGGLMGGLGGGKVQKDEDAEAEPDVTTTPAQPALPVTGATGLPAANAQAQGAQGPPPSGPTGAPPPTFSNVPPESPPPAPRPDQPTDEELERAAGTMFGDEPVPMNADRLPESPEGTAVLTGRVNDPQTTSQWFSPLPPVKGRGWVLMNDSEGADAANPARDRAVFVEEVREDGTAVIRDQDGNFEAVRMFDDQGKPNFYAPSTEEGAEYLRQLSAAQSKGRLDIFTGKDGDDMVFNTVGMSRTEQAQAEIDALGTDQEFEDATKRYEQLREVRAPIKFWPYFEDKDGKLQVRDEYAGISLRFFQPRDTPRADRRGLDTWVRQIQDQYPDIWISYSRDMAGLGGAEANDIDIVANILRGANKKPTKKQFGQGQQKPQPSKYGGLYRGQRWQEGEAAPKPDMADMSAAQMEREFPVEEMAPGEEDIPFQADTGDLFADQEPVTTQQGQQAVKGEELSPLFGGKQEKAVEAEPARMVGKQEERRPIANVVEIGDKPISTSGRGQGLTAIFKFRKAVQESPGELTVVPHPQGGIAGYRIKSASTARGKPVTVQFTIYQRGGKDLLVPTQYQVEGEDTWRPVAEKPGVVAAALSNWAKGDRQKIEITGITTAMEKPAPVIFPARLEAGTEKAQSEARPAGEPVTGERLFEAPEAPKSAKRLEFERVLERIGRQGAEAQERIRADAERKKAIPIEEMEARAKEFTEPDFTWKPMGSKFHAERVAKRANKRALEKTPLFPELAPSSTALDIIRANNSYSLKLKVASEGRKGALKSGLEHLSKVMPREEYEALMRDVFSVGYPSVEHVLDAIHGRLKNTQYNAEYQKAVEQASKEAERVWLETVKPNVEASTDQFTEAWDRAEDNASDQGTEKDDVDKVYGPGEQTTLFSASEEIEKEQKRIGLAHVRSIFKGWDVEQTATGWKLMRAGKPVLQIIFSPDLTAEKRRELGDEAFAKRLLEQNPDLIPNYEAALALVQAGKYKVRGQYRGTADINGVHVIVLCKPTAGPDTLFHEAFHFAWKNFLTPAQRGALIKFYKTEERAAREFGRLAEVQFKLENNEALNWAQKQLKEIWEWARRFVRAYMNPDELQFAEVFEKIYKGRIWEQEWLGFSADPLDDYGYTRYIREGGKLRSWNLSQNDVFGELFEAENFDEITKQALSPEATARALRSLFHKQALPQWNGRFYSKLAVTVRDAPQKKWKTAKDFMSWVQKQPGVKKDEIEWTGLAEFAEAAEQDGILNKEAILEYLEANGVQIEVIERTVSADDMSEQIDEIYRRLDDVGEKEFKARQKLLNVAIEKREELGNPKFSSHMVATAIDQLDDNKPATGDEIVFAENGVPSAIVDLEEFSTWQSFRLEMRRLRDEAYRLKIRRQNQGPQHESKSYRLPGGGFQYGEMAIRVPSLRGKTPHVESHAYPEENIIAWMRFNTRPGADGKRVLFIEEIQSDWQQEGEKKGFQPSRAEIQKRADEIAKELTTRNVTPEEIRKLGEALDPEASPDKFLLSEIEWVSKLHESGSKKGQPIGVVLRNGRLVQTAYAFGTELGGPSEAAWAKKHREETIARTALGLAKSELVKSEMYPNAPFRGSAWIELAMKMMMTWAVENGFDRIAWTSGEQQAERWAAQLRQVAAVAWNPETGALYGAEWVDDRTSELQKPKKTRGTFRHVGDVKNPKDLDRWVGADVANQLRAKAAAGPLSETDQPVGYIVEGEDVQLGSKRGAGLKKFYDDKLVNAASKLAKRFGGKIDIQKLADVGGWRAEEVGGHPLVPSKPGKKTWRVFNEHGYVQQAPGATAKQAIDYVVHFSEIDPDDVQFPTGQAGLDITDAMREEILTHGLELFQPDLDADVVRVSTPDGGMYQPGSQGDSEFQDAGVVLSRQTVKEWFRTKVMRQLFDKLDPIVELQEKLTKEGKKIAEGLDAYLKARNFSARAGALTSWVQKNLFQPFIDKLAELDIDLRTFDEFRMAVGALESNPTIFRMHVVVPRAALQKRLEQIKSIGLRKGMVVRVPDLVGVSGKVVKVTEENGKKKVQVEYLDQTRGENRLVEYDYDSVERDSKAEIDEKIKAIDEMVAAGDDPDKGVPHSGIPSAAAREILRSLREVGLLKFDGEPSNQTTYSGPLWEVSKLYDRIVRWKEQTLVDSGLLSQEELDRWRKDHPRFYCPMRGKAPDILDAILGGDRPPIPQIEPYGGSMWHRAVNTTAKAMGYKGEIFTPNIGRGYNPGRRAASRRRLGRHSLPTHSPTVELFTDALETAVRSEKNRVAGTVWSLFKSMAHLKDSNGDQLFIFDEPPMVRYYDAKTKTVKERPNTLALSKPNVYDIWLDGVHHYVRSNDPAMAGVFSALNNVGPESAPRVLRFFSHVVRYISKMATGRNPAFAIPNFVRDLTTAGIRLTADYKHLGTKTLKRVPEAVKLLARYARDPEKLTAEERRRVERFKAAGGETAFWLVPRLDTQAKNLYSEIQQAAKKDFRVFRWARLTCDFLEDYNGALEGATRFAVFEASLDAGASLDKASLAARDITVDFTRQGTWAGWMGGLYAFANASLQGSRMVYNTLKSPAGQKWFMGLMALGMTQAIVSRIAGGTDDDDDTDYWDKITAYEKSRNLIIMLPGGKGNRMKIPLPWGFNVPFMMGTMMMDAAVGLAGNKKAPGPVEAAANIVSSVMSAFNPIGDNSLKDTVGWMQMLSPSWLDPVADIAFNRTFWGGPIMPDATSFKKSELYGIPKKDHLRYFDSVSRPAREMTKGLYALTGVSVSPETVDYMVAAIGGGLGDAVNKAISMPFNYAQRGTLAAHEVPVVRSFFAEDSKFFAPQVYRANMADHWYKWETHRDLVKENPKEAAAYAKQWGYTIALHDKVLEVERQVSEMRKAGINPSDARLQKVYKTWNRLYDRLEADKRRQQKKSPSIMK